MQVIVSPCHRRHERISTVIRLHNLKVLQLLHSHSPTRYNIHCWQT